MDGRPTVIIGAGGHGREVYVWLRHAELTSRRHLVGFLDDGEPPRPLIERLGTAVIGSLEWLREHPGTVFYVGIGDPLTRRRVAARASELGGLPGPPLVHPTSVIGHDVELGDGSIVGPGAVATTNVRIGQHVYLGSNSVVGHDSQLADFVSVYPGATVSGNCVVEEGTTIGTNAAVRQQTRVGRESVVGAGAAVVKDVAPGTTVVGVPARPR